MKKFFVVYGGIYYGGEDSDTIEIFRDEQSAVDYSLWLEIVEGYNYTQIEFKEIRP